MRPGSTFQLIEALGSCQVGTVWSAVDAQGRTLTVALLDEAVAADQRWRDGFASTANSLLYGQPGGPRFLYADFSASAPWVACEAGDGPGAEQVFVALGMDYRPVTSSAGPAPNGAGSADSSSPPDAVGPAAGEAVDESPTVSFQPVSPPASPVSGSSPPISPSAPPVSGPPSQVSAAPAPVSGVPESPSAEPRWPTAGPLPPVADLPQQSPSPYDSGYPPLRSIEFDEPGRRMGLWIAVAVAAVLALAIGGGVYAWQASGGSPRATPSSSPQPVALPTASPVSPGVEPPKPGDWPSQWPKFKDTDRLRTISLDGIDFPVKIPPTWQCSAAGRARDYAKYTCGEPAGTGSATGGELTVRECPQPCGGQQQATMRQAEEAWGLQWVRTGQNASFAESSSLDIDGQQRYGLVVVAFWRSGEEGILNRELVFRATAPIDGAGLLRRVANYIRDAAVF